MIGDGDVGWDEMKVTPGWMMLLDPMDKRPGVVGAERAVAQTVEFGRVVVISNGGKLWNVLQVLPVVVG